MLAGMTSITKSIDTDVDDDPLDSLADGPLLTERDLARHWKLSPRTLQRWRADGKGPRFLRICDSVRYRPRDVLACERDGDSGEIMS